MRNPRRKKKRRLEDFVVEDLDLPDIKREGDGEETGRSQTRMFREFLKLGSPSGKVQQV